ncbi:Hypothetical protein, putative [Bodo saltans]|uniref:Uncharacterized protein n=1 Tax=Bodo saltans TaxID=75058 RepID=A0A0S4KKS4_BODSA|nr:Hypothetical protein, putative [Bodo saltans]|eukprot:CUI15179.1 Hypothetical protein, putative [Bodo saltans]
MDRSAAQTIALVRSRFHMPRFLEVTCNASAPQWFMITRLRCVYGVELVFAVDAPVGIVQHDTLRGAIVAKRGAERTSLLSQQLDLCAKVTSSHLDHAADGGAPARTPPPVQPVISSAEHLLKQNKRPQMLVEQVYETLFQLKVTVKHLDGEVDRYIGALVHDYDPICVFTGDSDFVVIPGIPVVVDFDYPWGVMLRGWNSFVVNGDEVSAPLRSGDDDDPLQLFILESEAVCDRIGHRCQIYHATPRGSCIC